jgi:hydroxymethylpyrimidine/phosphomethylpyrimidine kinase
MRTPTALAIAGSDSGGGAGVQADLKAFARCGVHGASAITAITAQNTAGVSAIHPVPAEVILAQVRAVVGDIGVDAVKVGMLGTASIARAVADALGELVPGTPVVVDPVMVSESGAALLEPDARGVLIEEILPRASVITPNLPEARELVAQAAGRQAGDGVEERREAEELVRALLAAGARCVVLTGGHRAQAIDLFCDSIDGEIVAIGGERQPNEAAHGSGCTHSSVLAAQLALGCSALDAARVARTVAGEAVARGLRELGAGPGPVDVIGLAQMRSSPPCGQSRLT